VRGVRLGGGACSGLLVGFGGEWLGLGSGCGGCGAPQGSVVWWCRWWRGGWGFVVALPGTGTAFVALVCWRVAAPRVGNAVGGLSRVLFFVLCWFCYE
jgi:hypothetical protein